MAHLQSLHGASNAWCPVNLHVHQALSARKGLYADTRHVSIALLHSYQCHEHTCETKGMALEVQHCIAAVPNFVCNSALPVPGMSREGQVEPSPW